MTLSTRTRLLTFWFKPISSHLACCFLTMLASVQFVLTMSSNSNSTPVEAPRFDTLSGRLRTPGSNDHSAIARQTHASLEYLRRHAGLGQDRSSQTVLNATSRRDNARTHTRRASEQHLQTGAATRRP